MSINEMKRISKFFMFGLWGGGRKGVLVLGRGMRRGKFVLKVLEYIGFYGISSKNERDSRRSFK